MEKQMDKKMETGIIRYLILWILGSFFFGAHICGTYWGFGKPPFEVWGLGLGVPRPFCVRGFRV